MDEQQAGLEPATPPVADNKAGAEQADWNQVLAALAPHAHELLKQVIEGFTRHGESSLHLRSLLLGIVAVGLLVLAGIALWLDQVDTAEKIVIALVSFLAGSMLGSGQSKK